MSWLVSAKQYIPAVIGEPFGGGYFAGYISHTADGNPTHALIVAPAATGATGTGYTLTTTLAWKATNTTTLGTTSLFDGSANTDAMVTAGISDHPAGNFCVGLSIGGYNDWYLPALLELDIAYFNLKPSTGANLVPAGINSYAVPQRPNSWTTDYPLQTTIGSFRAGAEAFQALRHWSSTENTVTAAVALDFAAGSRPNDSKNLPRSVRAFRRIAL